MRKLIAILLTLALLLALAGCQKSSGRNRRDDDEDDDRRQDDSGLAFPGLAGDAEEDDDISGEMPTQDVAEGSPAESQAEGVEFEYVLVDNSVRNDNGDILVSREYVKVVLLGDDPAYASINALIEADCELFLNSDIGWTVEELEEAVENLYGYDALFSDADAEVVHNEDGYLSIRIDEGWFMGGVCNCNFYGLTYDLTTGEEAKIEDVMGLPADEALVQLRELSAERLVEYYGQEGLLVEPAGILADYTLDDFRFYLESGELVLAFYTYEFACGAAGPADIHTGIYIGDR